MSRIGFSGAIDRLPAVQDVLNGLQPLASNVDAKQIAGLRSQLSSSLNAVVGELGKEEGPNVEAVDAHLSDARAQIEELGQSMGYVDETGGVVAEGAGVDSFHEVSDYIADIEVAWRNQRPSLLELQNALPYRRSRIASGLAGALLVVLLLLWLLLRNSHPSPVAASDAPVFPTPPLSSVAPPSSVVAPPFNTNLNWSSRPNTTPPLNISLPNETRSRTAGTDYPPIDLNTMLPTVKNYQEPTGPLVVTPQEVTERCNKDNTFLAPTGYKIINNTGSVVYYSVTVDGNWAIAAPAGGALANGSSTAVGETPTVDANGKIWACQQLVNEGRDKGQYFMTITVDNVAYRIVVTVKLYNAD